MPYTPATSPHSPPETSKDKSVWPSGVRCSLLKNHIFISSSVFYYYYGAVVLFHSASSAHLLSGAGHPSGRSDVWHGRLLSLCWPSSSSSLLGHGHSRTVSEPNRRGRRGDSAVLSSPVTQHERPSSGLSGVASGSRRTPETPEQCHRALWVPGETSSAYVCVSF